MHKIFFILTLVFLPLNLLSNEISWPYLVVSDYYRGTAGERLFFSNHEDLPGNIFIYNDLRNYNFKNYFSKNEKKEKDERYSRFINIISMNYIPLNNMILSLRIPYVNAKNEYNSRYTFKNSGISDIFIGLSYKIVEYSRNKIYFSTGLKSPTGKNFHNIDKIPISTGSYDIPLIINTNFSFKNTNSFLDFGYIFIGKSEIYPFRNNKKEENGDEIFFDFAFIKKLLNFSLIAEFNYFYIFKISKYYDDSKYKLSIVPGMMFTPFINKMKIEIGYSYDIKGRNVYSGNSLIFRVFYGF